jgi:hypothetical protein
MQTRLEGQNYKDKYGFLQKIAVLSSLGEYDFLDLAMKSQIKEYIQGSETRRQKG